MCDLSVENSLPQEEQDSGIAGRVCVREFPERREKMFDKQQETTMEMLVAAKDVESLKSEAHEHPPQLSPLSSAAPYGTGFAQSKANPR